MLTACHALVAPIAVAGKFKEAGDTDARGPYPKPLVRILCGDPAALSVRLIDPLRAPIVVGVNTTERVQLPAAATVVPQLSVSEKSPLLLMVSDRGSLAIFRSTTV